MIHNLVITGDTVTIDNHTIKFENTETAKAFVQELVLSGFLYR